MTFSWMKATLLLLSLCHSLAAQGCPCAHRAPIIRALYDATRGPQWTRPWDMTSASLPCGLEGISCSALRQDVTSIALYKRGLNGQLPVELSNLTNLVSIDVSHNFLSGTLHPEYASWAALTDCTFLNNSISGSIHASFSQWTSIASVNFAINKFTGTLSAAFSAWSNISWIAINDNSLSGTLPVEYARWPLIGSFFINTNQLSGPLPPEYSDWSSTITAFNVGNNSLSGELPSAYNAWKNLKDFEAVNNSGPLTGTLPEEYGVWSNLQYFFISLNNFSGSLPASYGAWTKIRRFEVDRNVLSGTLPSAYRSWVSVENFVVQHNLFSGSLPNEYGKLVEMSTFNVGENRMTGTIPASYKTWTKVRNIQVFTNAFSGTLPNTYGALVMLEMFQATGNALTGTIPLSLVTLPRMSIFAVGYNQLSGRLPTRCSPTIKALLFQHNTRIVGALPMELLSFSAIGVCGTGMCPSTTLPFQYCLPSEVMFSSQDQSDLLRLASPFQEVCDPKAVVNLRPSRTTTPILSPVHDVAGFPTGASSELLPAMLVMSLATGTGGVGLARGAVPSLQRSSSALRAMSQCVAPGEESDEAPPPYSALEDNPLALPITMRGSGDLDGAVSAGVGNGLLVGIIAIVLHMVAVMQQWSTRLTSKGPLLRFMCRIVKALPSSLLPGSFAVTYGTLLQPSVGACVSLIASENRSLASVICGLLLLCVWCSLPAYCLFAVVWRGRRSTHDGKFALECIACAPSARVTRGRQQMQLKERWLALVAHIAEPTHQWTVRSRSGATKATTDFLSENMEAVFGGYVREREWFFIVQWTTAIISGIMQGALETAGTDDPTLACPTAYASCAVAMVFTAGDVITTLWLQPLSVRLEMWGGVGVSVLSILSQILVVLSDAPQSADVVISTAAILELLVMTFLMLHVAFVSLRSSDTEKRNTIHNNQVNLRNMQLGRPLARMGVAQQPQQQHHAQVELDVTGHADVQLMLKRLVTMACNDQQSRRWML